MRKPYLAILLVLALIVPGMMNAQAAEVGMLTTPDDITFFFSDIERGVNKTQTITLTNSGELSFTNITYEVSFQLQAYITVSNVYGVLNPQQDRTVSITVFIPAYSSGMTLTGSLTITGITGNNAQAAVSTNIDVNVADFNGALSAFSIQDTYDLTENVEVWATFKNLANVDVTTADILYETAIFGTGSFVWNSTVGKYTMKHGLLGNIVTDTYVMNITTYFAGKHYSASVSFDIDGITPDYIAPVLTMITINPTQPTMNSNITVSAYVTDYGSGVNNVYCEIYIPSMGYQNFGNVYNYSNTSSSLVLYRRIAMMPELSTGTYKAILNPATIGMTVNVTYTIKITATDFQANANTSIGGSFALQPEVYNAPVGDISGIIWIALGILALIIVVVLLLLMTGKKDKGGNKTLGKKRNGGSGGLGFGAPRNDSMRDRIASNYPDIADQMYEPPPSRQPPIARQPRKKDSRFFDRNKGRDDIEFVPVGLPYQDEQPTNFEDDDFEELPPFDDEPTHPRRPGGSRKFI